MQRKKHLVLVTADHAIQGGHSTYKCGDKYLRALSDCAKSIPLILPAMADAIDLNEALDHCSGVLFTGAISNIYPTNYAQEPSEQAEPYDKIRDQVSLPLIQACIARKIPFLGICRGFQELNVAMKGTLFARLHEQEGRFDHRDKGEFDIAVKYAQRHDVKICKGGLLEQIFPNKETLSVNSLHWQGVDKPAPSLRIEAIAPDQTIEALSVKESWGLAVQWHPEFMAKQTPEYRALFEAFEQAMTAYEQSKN